MILFNSSTSLSNFCLLDLSIPGKRVLGVFNCKGWLICFFLQVYQFLICVFCWGMNTNKGCCFLGGSDSSASWKVILLLLLCCPHFTLCEFLKIFDLGENTHSIKHVNHFQMWFSVLFSTLDLKFWLCITATLP